MSSANKWELTRPSLRLKSHDYKAEAYYFITICACRRIPLFGSIRDGSMQLNSVGQAIKIVWNSMPERFSQLKLDTFVVMPDHIHGILRFEERSQVHLGNIIGAFKSLATREYKRVEDRPLPSLWQKNFYERVIRNEDELDEIRAYILNNPMRWNELQNTH